MDNECTDCWVQHGDNECNTLLDAAWLMQHTVGCSIVIMNGAAWCNEVQHNDGCNMVMESPVFKSGTSCVIFLVKDLCSYFVKSKC